jgi:hypothetical protein
VPAASPANAGFNQPPTVPIAIGLVSLAALAGAGYYFFRQRAGAR